MEHAVDGDRDGRRRPRPDRARRPTSTGPRGRWSSSRAWPGHPLLVSLLLSWQATGLVALDTIACVVVLSLEHAPFLDQSTLLRVAGAAATAGFAVVNAAVRRQREARLARITRVAEVAQEAILPAVPPELGGFAIASRYVSASHDALVGGDLFDAGRHQPVRPGPGRGRAREGPPGGQDGRARAVGVPAAGRPSRTAPLDVAVALDDSLQGDLGEEDFVTAVLRELGPLRTLEIVNCGHPAPLLVPADGAPRELTATMPALPLGLGTEPGARPVPARPRGPPAAVHRRPVGGARRARGVPRPGRSRRRAPRPRPQYAVDGLLAAAAGYAGGTLADDVAVLLVDVTDAGPRPPAGTGSRLLTRA